MNQTKPQILLTNDDGIESPGLWAAAEALSEIGYVWVAAPRDQASSTGRSMPLSSDGTITVRQMTVHGQEWTVHAVGGTPAQTVQHGILEIIGQKPDLIVSGINYGLNLGTAVTISGTLGAAMEGASFGIPSLAVSLETDQEAIYTHSKDIDFSQAAYFTAYFGRRVLDQSHALGSRFLKIEVPSDATKDTPWKLAHLGLENYYFPVAKRRESWDQPYKLGFSILQDLDSLTPGTDMYVTLVERKVAVTPMTLDMTANLDFEEFRQQLDGEI